MWRFLLLATFVAAQRNGMRPKSCGAYSIPYEVTVDLAGRPEMSCDAPACIGEPTMTRPAHNFDFFSMRHRRRRYKRAITIEKKAECDREFTENVCSANNEWTGGVMEYNNGTHISLRMECCRFEGLNYGTPLSTVSLQAGDRYKGGSVYENGKLVAFDLIKEVRKNVSEHNEVSYVLSVYRISCIPDPVERRNNVSKLMEDDAPYLRNPVNARGFRRQPVREVEYESDYETPPARNYMPRRRRPIFYPRRRQYYRPIFDEYDYYDLEPIPMVRRPGGKRPGPRGNVYGPQNRPLPPFQQQRARAYSDTFAYNPSEPLEEYTEYPYAGGEAVATTPINTLPPSFTETPFPTVRQANNPLPEVNVPGYNNFAPAPLAPGSSYIQPQNQLVAPAPQITNTYVQQPQPLPVYQSAYQPQSVSYATAQNAQPASCVDPCTAANQYQQANQYQYQQQYQAQDPYAGQATGTDLNSIFSSLQCFSGDMEVETPSGSKRMDELEIGDMILSVEHGAMVYSPVITFLHKKPSEEASFRLFETDDKRQIKLTDFHLIYVSNCKPNAGLSLVHAKDVKLGQCVQIKRFERNTRFYQSKIVKIETVNEKGIYAPLTASGDLLVNSVLASCHSNMGVQTLQQSFFAVHRKLEIFVTSVKTMLGISTPQAYGELPIGVDYIVSVMDIFLPKSFFG
uniref:Hint domain-containing protein n=1 Tax=Panagrellus redivivus TaxID=6233 RepID=A0A7E4VFJ1_PANRE